MKKYLKQRIDDMKRELKWHEKLAEESKITSVREEALKAIYQCMGGIEELEAILEKFEKEL